ncbi:ParB/RepB/Spo0J family partition protein [Aliiroseovarius sp. PTFE2010]|uniref:ParB/RepB/Spo0J family partition protein n=1 Tax=Aliiroseovarius sp. PTFE2010 TaxID=3417190 RepID=UPI003CF05DF9
MANKNQKSRGLGRGLSALMADVVPESESSDQPAKPERFLPIEAIAPNPDQPRRQFNEADLRDLSESIKEKGVIQPLIVRPAPRNGGQYQIVAGERRWRASQLAQLHELPVIVRDYTDVEVLEIAIIENIQRADLNPVEEATGYRQLMDRFGHTQEKLAEALGKSRPHIANLLRLLTLPDEVLDLLKSGEISAGHARALVTSDDPVSLAKKVVSKGLSVRATEALAKKGNNPTQAAKPKPKSIKEKDADTRALESDLSAALGMAVAIDHQQGAQAGEITISYKTLDELDDLCGKLSA